MAQTVRVGILDPIPASRRGLSATLTDADLVPEEITNLVSWTAGRIGPKAAVVHVLEDSELHRVAAAVAKDPSLTVVVVQAHDDDGAVRRALAAGAVASVSDKAPLEELADVLRLALGGKSVLPARTVRALVHRMGAPPDDSLVSEREAEWIKRLAAGMTVSELARWAGYSEREMYRHLSHIYVRMGVRNRTEAVVRAAHWGLVS